MSGVEGISYLLNIQIGSQQENCHSSDNGAAAFCQIALHQGTLGQKIYAPLSNWYLLSTFLPFFYRWAVMNTGFLKECGFKKI